MKTEQQWAEQITRKIIEKMRSVRERSSGKIPYTAVNGTHDDKGSAAAQGGRDDGLAWWTNGFWGGMLWLMYHETKDERYAEIASYSEERLDALFEGYYELFHDVGFMWLLTSVANYRLTGSLESRKRGMHAAAVLASRFNPAGGFIRAWNDREESDTRGWAIIDCMMNIPLLYWASEETSDPCFRHIAKIHADTVMNTFVRPDGSVHHIVEFDPESGEMIQALGGQGYAQGSSWTRGQAWALYGFAMSYIHTREEKYLDTAKRVAHYFMANIPKTGIIPVDFRQPAQPAIEDTTAAAIASSGLLEIARWVPETEKAMYREAALHLLETLERDRCNWDPEVDYFLENGSAAYHDAEHHYPIIYGDYYFIEAIMKLKGNDIFLW